MIFLKIFETVKAYNTIKRTSFSYLFFYRFSFPPSLFFFLFYDVICIFFPGNMGFDFETWKENPNLLITYRLSGMICGGFYGPYLYLVVSLGGLYLSGKKFTTRAGSYNHLSMPLSLQLPLLMPLLLPVLPIKHGSLNLFRNA